MMGLPVLILGKSGSGKSASLRNFKDDIGIINVLGKPLPFKNELPCVTSDDYSMVMAYLAKSKTRAMVIDDAGYLMTNMFMRGHGEKQEGNKIYTFYNEIGDGFWNVIRYVVEHMEPHRIVYFMMHEDKNDFGDIKPKTIGRMLDEKVCVEGMFTIVLRCLLFNGKHIFRTQSDGCDVAKSPMDMFPEEIDNDLKLVDDTMRKYYNMEAEK